MTVPPCCVFVDTCCVFLQCRHFYLCACGVCMCVRVYECVVCDVIKMVALSHVLTEEDIL